MKIGFLGFGEVGYTLAKGIREHFEHHQEFHQESSVEFDQKSQLQLFAFDVNQTKDWQGEQIQKHAQETNVHLVSSLEELTRRANLILSVIPALLSIQTAWQISGYLQPHHFYCDLSSASPNTKRQAGETIHKDHGFYIDGAIMGSMKTYGFKAPIYLSGEHAHSVQDLFNFLGLYTSVVSSEIGGASALKLLRSSFTKGMEALLVETFYTASLFHAEDAVLDTLSDTFDRESFRKTVTRYLTTSAIHADRRVIETGEVINLLQESGVTPYLAKASYDRLNWVAQKKLRDKFKGTAPADFHEVLRAFKDQP